MFKTFRTNPLLSRSLPAVAAAALLCALTGQAHALTLKVKCETRAGRSTASVDAAGLAAGQYGSTVLSGANTASSPLDVAVAGEVGFDYASNPKDIHKGAAPIAADFIQGQAVTGVLLDAHGVELARKSAVCRAR